MKTGFILHLDSLAVLDELTNEQAGILFKAIRDYNLGVEPELDFAMKMAFLPFKNQFIRDFEKYENTCERNKTNGMAFMVYKEKSWKEQMIDFNDFANTCIKQKLFIPKYDKTLLGIIYQGKDKFIALESKLPLLYV